MATALAYLYWRSRERFLLFWLAATALWTVRYAVGTSMMPFVLSLTVGRALLMFLGARDLGRKPLGIRPVLALTAVVLVAVLAGYARGIPAALALAVFLMAASLMYSGLVLARAARFARAERLVVAAAFLAMGAMQFTYPFIAGMPWVASAGFGTSVLTQTIVAVGILIMFLRARVDEAHRLAGQREMALARVLSDFVTICSHCKSIRNEHGDWQTPRLYVETHTEMSVATQLCADCAEKGS